VNGIEYRPERHHRTSTRHRRTACLGTWPGPDRP
jgi:hypothetical protein